MIPTTAAGCNVWPTSAALPKSARRGHHRLHARHRLRDGQRVGNHKRTLDEHLKAVVIQRHVAETQVAGIGAETDLVVRSIVCSAMILLIVVISGIAANTVKSASRKSLLGQIHEEAARAAVLIRAAGRQPGKSERNGSHRVRQARSPPAGSPSIGRKSERPRTVDRHRRPLRVRKEPAHLQHETVRGAVDPSCPR